ncbi:MAPK protein hog1 [Termitomyces sp. T32_za158]|nr:MAPK protein hog1 [Termitomyces sp. T32_za158]
MPTMLVFDPRKRIDAAQSLAHEYVGPYHDPTDEPVADEKFDWSFNDADLPVDTWKVMMYKEILGAFNINALIDKAGMLRYFCVGARPDFHQVDEEGTDFAASGVPEGALSGPDYVAVPATT